ncbi:MAG: bifunctional folylpolyglutamate synthase/dihydrofolate synthase [Lachnospiraceae bacterium]|nr:bifunctional folylpolyglutamate synthase/dihydrofolate synthase [Lachnospiraceae bacterium]
MTYEQVLERLTNTEFFSAFAGLYRMRAMLRYFDDPQDAIPCVHVAGTNGKGSVCSVLDSVLRQAGYRVGLFTSPYLVDFRERIRVNGEMIPKEDLARIGTEVYEYLGRSFAPANQFELLTVIAFLYFRHAKCDIVILETGLGGTYDPTNAVSAPLCSVITNIGLDHCKVLGNTIPEIAAAKAGIIKRGRDVCVYPVVREAQDVITEFARRADAPIHVVDCDELVQLPAVSGYEHFSYKGLEVMLSLRGLHQQYNAATAMEAIRVINENGFYISDRDIVCGMKTVKWPARLEKLCAKPVVFLDGGHNPQCMRAVADWFKTGEYAGRPLTVITGMVADKDVRSMLSVVSEMTDKIYFYRFENKRALSEEEVDKLCEEFGMERVYSLAEICETLFSSAGNKDVFLITGSLYLAAEAKETVAAFIEKRKKDSNEQVEQ